MPLPTLLICSDVEALAIPSSGGTCSTTRVKVLNASYSQRAGPDDLFKKAPDRDGVEAITCAVSSAC